MFAEITSEIGFFEAVVRRVLWVREEVGKREKGVQREWSLEREEGRGERLTAAAVAIVCGGL